MADETAVQTAKTAHRIHRDMCNECTAAWGDEVDGCDTGTALLDAVYTAMGQK